MSVFFFEAFAFVVFSAIFYLITVMFRGLLPTPELNRHNL
jgi:hypothetical protein